MYLYYILGSDVTPNPLSGRFVIIFVLFLSVTIYDYYTSVFVSALIKSGSKNKIKSVRDLADSEYTVGFEEIPYIHSHLEVRFARFDRYIQLKSIKEEKT